MLELGQILNQARAAKGISLEEAAAATKIKVEYLQALEEERFDDLPSLAYVRGFLKIYTRYLGLESEPLLRAYAEQYQPVPPQVILVEQKRIPSVPWLPGIKWRLVVTTLGGLLAAVLVLLGVINIIRGELESGSAVRAFSTRDDPYDLRTIEKISLPFEAVTPGGRSAKLELEVKAKEDVWLEVHADGSLIFLSTLKALSQNTWQADKDFQIKISHPGKVRLFFNREEVKLPRKSASPLTVSLTQGGIGIND